MTCRPTQMSRLQLHSAHSGGGEKLKLLSVQNFQRWGVIRSCHQRARAGICLKESRRRGKFFPEPRSVKNKFVSMSKKSLTNKKLRAQVSQKPTIFKTAEIYAHHPKGSNTCPGKVGFLAACYKPRAWVDGRLSTSQ